MTEGAPPPSLPRRVAGRLGGLLCLSFLRLGHLAAISFFTLMLFLAIPAFAAYFLIARMRLWADHRRFLRLARRAGDGDLPLDWRGEDHLDFSEHREWWDPTFSIGEGPPPFGLWRLIFWFNLYPKLSMLYRRPLRHNVHELLWALVRYPHFPESQVWLRRLRSEFAWLARRQVGGERLVPYWRHQRACAQNLIRHINPPPEQE